ncbi:hypothetical protein ABZZ17_00375 [Streptomyces sp. NPDC006512]|uniref:hypothetical protein n=1 Tax=Streptomyces sp. NPDC006512 TaxID=3154307 RepID=UPI0033A3AFC8
MRVRVAAVAAVLAVTLSGCVTLGRPEAPYGGPPVPVETVVGDMTSAFAEAGVALTRMPQEYLSIECHEYLYAEHDAATADAVLKDAFKRAEGRGWKVLPPYAEGGHSLRKANWTAHAQPLTRTAGEPTTAVSFILQCDGGMSKKQPGSASTAPAPSSPAP